MTDAKVTVRTNGRVCPGTISEHMRTLGPSFVQIEHLGPYYAIIHITGIMLSRLLPALIVYQDDISDLLVTDFEYTT